jgi:hypothetical protein
MFASGIDFSFEKVPKRRGQEIFFAFEPGAAERREPPFDATSPVDKATLIYGEKEATELPDLKTSA